VPFDARAAKLLQPGEHIILPEHPGLRLTATATRRSWQYRYKSPVDGGMRQIKIGEWPRIGYIEAAAEWQRLRGERDSGIDLQLQKKNTKRVERAQAAEVAKGPYLVIDLIEDYLSGHIDKNRKPKGRAEVRRVLTKNTVAIHDREAHLLRRNEAFDLIQSMSGTPVLAGQVRQEMGAAYAYGLDSGRLPESTPNFWREILRGKMPRSKGKLIQGEHVAAKRVLSEAEIGYLINWTPNFSKTVGDVVTLYLWTGTRGTEIMQMQASEIVEEPTGWWWTIPKH
jgi:hypothetical protein